MLFVMSIETKPIEFKTSITKVGEVTLYAKLDPILVNHLGLKRKDTGTATVVDGNIVLNFNK